MYDNQSGLTPFRFWCQKVLPLVYDDSLSYYELLCKVVQYLNNTIQAVNETTADVEELKNLYIQLKEYVDNYFYNLNVDEAINNKLDDMVESGAFPASWFINRIQGNVLSEKNNSGFTKIGELGLTTGYRTQASQLVKDGNNYYLYVLQHESDYTPLICSKYSFPDLTLVANKIVADPTDSNSPFYYNGNSGGVHGNSMCYDDVNNQLIISDTVTGYLIYVPLENYVTSTPSYWRYLGNSAGKVSGFCVSPTDSVDGNKQYAAVIPTSTNEVLMYYVNDGFSFAKIIGRGKMGEIGNTLKQDCCMSESNFVYFLCTNVTHMATDETYNSMTYDNNIIMMYSPQVGLFKKIYYPKYFGIEMEGISRAKSIPNIVDTGFILTDLYGGVYVLEMDKYEITSSHILKTRDLLTGLDEPFITFGGNINLSANDQSTITTPTASMNEINCVARGGYKDINVYDGNISVIARSWLYIPTEIQTIRMKSGGSSFAQNRNFRNVINPVSMAGYTGIARQSGNQFVVNMNTGFCNFNLIYTVQDGTGDYKDGVAVLSGYHFTGWNYNNSGQEEVMEWKYYSKFYSKGVNPVSYTEVFEDFRVNCIPMILEHLTRNIKALESVTNYTMFIANMGGAYAYPRYSQSAIFTIPLIVEGE